VYGRGILNPPTVRSRAQGSARSAVVRLAAAGCALALALALTGCGGASESSGAQAREPPATRSTYTLMQMNLCLSGFAGCFGRTAYPAVVDEAVARIRETRPDAVTVNEVCRRDVARIARQTGYHVRFSRVFYAGRELPCIRPGGRGLFGIAVLAAAAIERTDRRDFAAQAGPERRRWLCIVTRAGVDVCTAHLNTRSAVEVAGNDAQCTELAALLAGRMAVRAVIFGGDVNRRRSCAPDGAWTRTDSSAGQAAGLQHVYGSDALRSSSVRVVPAAHTDHDILLVRARLTSGRASRPSRRGTARDR
jgi:endonuclease/exonuclease/phosphatase family metal-dependent hydrolase